MQIKNIQGLRVAEIGQLVNQGGKFVIFPYTVSIVVMTFKRPSSIYFIRPDEGTFKYSYKHVAVNAVMGWWGIPWGPIYTIGAMYHQLSGGKDVTQAVMSDLIQNDPEANTSTYNINGTVSHNMQQQQQENSGASAYNVPRN
ncbi:hypothetical protein HYN59_11560 [Flavobacterium album]|uniref:Uncharacterized protein n=1 Tax=Flavobacterium album TaxID=2175091 RepID=A0A2S1QZB7_9FLAO|nr:hypothetical protein [Flavobacterium album]AWH85704.1 hypothetical protein HYN59_11560 [Flavobacterium album]